MVRRVAVFFSFFGSASALLAPRSRLSRPLAAEKQEKSSEGPAVALQKFLASPREEGGAALSVLRDKFGSFLDLKSFVGGTFLGVALTVSLALSVDPFSDDLTSREVRIAGAQFEAVLDALDRGYVDVIEPKKLFESAMNSMLNSLDPYTEFEATRQASDLQESVEGLYGGVGLVISKKPVTGEVIVVDAFEGYAWESGLRPGDVLLNIGGVAMTKDTPMDDVRSLLRGLPGTAVTVEYSHAWREPQTIDLPRKVVIRRDVDLATLLGPRDDRVAYVKLSGFSRVAAAELRNALVQLTQAISAEQPLKGVVLDLRGNPGGLLDGAIDVASLFVPPGSQIVSADGRGFLMDGQPGARTTFSSTPESGELFGVPLVVLVDGNTASASEIVAAAIQDLDSGLIVGSEKTFGKGLIQNIAELPFDAKLKVTVGRYYTPSGRCLQALEYSRGDDSVRKEKASKLSGFEYKTRTGRLVKDGGGVTPDLSVKSSNNLPTRSELLLLSRGTFDTYADAYTRSHSPRASQMFSASEEQMPKKGLFMAKSDVADLKKIALKLVSEDDLLDEPTRTQLREELTKSDTSRLAEATLRSRFFRASDILRADLDDDAQLREATKLIHDTKRYDALLLPPR